MRCIIVDDELMSREHLLYLCGRIAQVQVVGVFEDALSAYHFLEDNPVDLMFLDIEMPDFSGIELVQQLTVAPAVVFVTSRSDYAAKTFDFIEKVQDYLVKPVTLPRLLKAVERYQIPAPAALPDATLVLQEADESTDEVPPPSHIKSDASHIFVKTDRKYVRIDLNKLQYVESVGDYCIFKTEERQFTVHTTLKSVAERLDESKFVKVHRSFIINLDKIKDIEDYNLLIQDKVIPISRTHRALLMERIMPL
jgi:DNA-binding LytR/AlgR family response regulator